MIGSIRPAASISAANVRSAQPRALGSGAGPARSHLAAFHGRLFATLEPRPHSGAVAEPEVGVNTSGGADEFLHAAVGLEQPRAARKPERAFPDGDPPAESHEVYGGAGRRARQARLAHLGNAPALPRKRQ